MAKMYDAVELKAFGETFLADPILKMSFNAVLRNAPAVEAEPVVHAFWQMCKGESYDNRTIYFRCSHCKKYRFHNDEMRKKYERCPKCGAIMDLEVGRNGG